jgi:uncharacterized protein (DUF305 family)
MAVEQTTIGQPKPSHKPMGSSRLWLLIPIVLALVVGALGALAANRVTRGAADLGFLRDMMTHHAQAVEMGLILYDRTENPDLRAIALDIVLTQQTQIGHMQGWLREWGEALASTERSMTWMGMPTDGLMPGMATDEQLEELRSLSGQDADRLFINLMIVHHLSGVEMAEAILARSSTPVVRDLAQSIVASQQREIDAMNRILEEMGDAPVAEGTPMHNH